ncbi:hypothetical protein VTN49DRAFT_6926 [Thermomyces lanuginosus]|uniref:uncharacterized protein n=1 Tax=Thermomyces lanuginosus TaxID=5541 RepID=UPI00374208AB
MISPDRQFGSWHLISQAERGDSRSCSLCIPTHIQTSHTKNTRQMTKVQSEEQFYVNLSHYLSQLHVIKSLFNAS